MPPFFLRNFAHGNVARHNGIVVESKAYFFPGISKMLAEHHRKQLVPTGEVLHVAIAIILANVVVKLSPVQKSGKLSKNVFVLEHSSQLYLAAKLQNQVRFISKNCLID